MVDYLKQKKKEVLISGIAILGIALIAISFSVFGNHNGSPVIQNGTDSSATSTTVSVPSIDTNDNAGTNESDPALNVESKEDVNVDLSEFTKNTQTPSAPTVSNESALTNPSQTPTYNESQTKVDETDGQPKNGDKKDGYIYVEGFGWIKDEGGSAVGEEFGSDGDINKQVGQMN